jgi:hypothetical protein
MTVTTLSNNRIHIRIAKIYGTPSPWNPIAVSARINLSVLSAIPTVQLIPKASAFARIYGTRNPKTMVAIITG